VRDAADLLDKMLKEIVRLYQNQFDFEKFMPLFSERVNYLNAPDCRRVRTLVFLVGFLYIIIYFVFSNVHHVFLLTFFLFFFFFMFINFKTRTLSP
jgi:hypothetical protein